MVLNQHSKQPNKHKTECHLPCPIHLTGMKKRKSKLTYHLHITIISITSNKLNLLMEIINSVHFICREVGIVIVWKGNLIHNFLIQLRIISQGRKYNSYLINKSRHSIIIQFNLKLKYNLSRPESIGPSQYKPFNLQRQKPMGSWDFKALSVIYEPAHQADSKPM